MVVNPSWNELQQAFMQRMFSHWRKDLPASLVVFLVAVPLCLGIALASGAPLMAGLISGVIGGIVVGLISGSNLGVSGPAAGLAAIVLTSIGQLGSFPLFLTAVVLSGLIQIVLGFLRAGVIANYFPNSVIKGMLAGIGVIIFLKQIPHAVGDDKDYLGDESFDQPDKLNTFEELWYALQDPAMGAVIITLACIAIMLLWERPFIKRIKAFAFVPGPLLAVVLGTVLSRLLNSHQGLALNGQHFVGLPDLSNGISAALTFPDPAGLMNGAVWTIALTLAIVASIETLLSVEATDRLDPEKRITPTNLELKAQGVGNLISGLIGGLPITQVIVRSSANIQSGGRSKLSAVVHGVLILLSVLLIPGLMNMIPLASLAAILLITGYKLAKPSLFKAMYEQGWYIFIPFIVTVLGVVFIDLLKGVALGMSVGIFFVLRNSYLTPFHVMECADDDGPVRRIILSEEVTFFNKASIQRTLTQLPAGAHLVIDASHTMNLEPDVLDIIREAEVREKERGVKIELIGLRTPKKRSTTELIESVLGTKA